MEKSLETLLSKCEIPIIDLEHVGTVACPMKSVITRVGAQLQKALSQKGLALLVNHGIPEQKMSKVYSTLDNFCDLPTEVKEKYLRNAEHGNHGYIKPGMEMFDGETPEIRHTFNICTLAREGLPEDVLPGFRASVASLAADFKQLSILLLQALAIGLELPSNFFLERHGQMLNDNDDNASTLRLLYYPPCISEEDEEIDYVKGSCGYEKYDRRPSQIPNGVLGSIDQLDCPKFTRCGSHCDYGTFTLLVQDSEGGLEVKLPHTERWQRVGHLPGAILINTGELLAAWTQERYPALPHRVIIPEHNVRNRGRHAIAFFCHPDNCTPIAPLDLPEEQCPFQKPCKKTPKEQFKNAKDRVFTACQHLQKRFRETYAS
uniref:Putative iron/ascorbate family oxidoreductase n=1 Tax=Xenopsylla cheopis TaxID=163159 RepID=A0A6M2DV74_XENCH